MFRCRRGLSCFYLIHLIRGTVSYSVTREEYAFIEHDLYILGHHSALFQGNKKVDQPLGMLEPRVFEHTATCLFFRLKTTEELIAIRGHRNR